MFVNVITKKGNNVKILFDDESVLLLNYNVFIDSRLRKNDLVTGELLSELVRKNECFTIKNTALNLLARRQHSQKELLLKLLKRNYPKSLCLEMLNELEEFNYLDDKAFANNYAEEKIKKGKCGINKIKADLIKKGIDKKIISDIEWKYSDSEELRKSLYYLALKKINLLKTKEITSIQIKNKVISHLLSKGFTYEQVNDTINSIIKLD